MHGVKEEGKKTNRIHTKRTHPHAVVGVDHGEAGARDSSDAPSTTGTSFGTVKLAGVSITSDIYVCDIPHFRFLPTGRRGEIGRQIITNDIERLLACQIPGLHVLAEISLVENVPINGKWPIQNLIGKDSARSKSIRNEISWPPPRHVSSGTRVRRGLVLICVTHVHNIFASGTCSSSLPVLPTVASSTSVQIKHQLQ
jgi:hypothetical protein